MCLCLYRGNKNVCFSLISPRRKVFDFSTNFLSRAVFGIFISIHFFSLLRLIPIKKSIVDCLQYSIIYIFCLALNIFTLKLLLDFFLWCKNVRWRRWQIYSNKFLCFSCHKQLLHVGYRLLSQSLIFEWRNYIQSLTVRNYFKWFE